MITANKPQEPDPRTHQVEWVAWFRNASLPGPFPTLKEAAELRRVRAAEWDAMEAQTQPFLVHKLSASKGRPELAATIRVPVTLCPNTGEAMLTEKAAALIDEAKEAR